MKFKLFTIFDQKAGAFLPPFSFTTIAQAERAFLDSCATVDHMFNKHPEDYSLHICGEFNDDNAIIEPESPPKILMTALAAHYQLREAAEAARDANIPVIKESLK